MAAPRLSQTSSTGVAPIGQRRRAREDAIGARFTREGGLSVPCMRGMHGVWSAAAWRGDVEEKPAAMGSLCLNVPPRRLSQRLKEPREPPGPLDPLPRPPEPPVPPP